MMNSELGLEGLSWSGGALGSNQTRGDVAQDARLWGSDAQEPGRAPGQTAVSRPEARPWEEAGDNSLSGVWNLRFLWDIMG